MNGPRCDTKGQTCKTLKTTRPPMSKSCNDGNRENAAKRPLARLYGSWLQRPRLNSLAAEHLRGCIVFACFAFVPCLLDPRRNLAAPVCDRVALARPNPRPVYGKLGTMAWHLPAHRRGVRRVSASSVSRLQLQSMEFEIAGSIC